MINVCTVDNMRRYEAHMIDELGIPGSILMENAANAVINAVIRASGERGAATPRVVILCGGGNNGGDGLAVLRGLVSRGMDAEAVLICDPACYRGDARLNYDIAVKTGMKLHSDMNRIRDADIIVDAVFGTGLNRPVTGAAYDAITLANTRSAYRIAVDVPSGMNGDDGSVQGCVFNADETITFHAIKRGLLLTRERSAVGKLTVAPIGVMAPEQETAANREVLADRDFVSTLLPKRREFSNKGDHGRAGLIVGSYGMAGAALLASRAALRVGSGLTKSLIPAEILPSFAAIPEVMTLPDDSRAGELIEWATALCIGCGMGVSERTARFTEAVLRSKKPAVIDADALNCISREERLLELLHENIVITPHPAEMARLIGVKTSEVTGDLAGTALRFSDRHGCTVLLKSAVSVIASPDGRLRWNTTGNSGLAKGGSGDVLAGLVTGLMAQGVKPCDAATAGAYLLGASADAALEILYERALTAGDAAETAALVINELKKEE